MSTATYILAIIVMGLVALVLIRGLFNMMKGGDSNLSNKLMQLRVLLQAIAVILIGTYGAMLIFSLVTHKQLFVGGEADIGGADGAADGEHEKPWPVGKAVIVLLVATLAVAWVSEFLVGAVEAARQSLGVTEVFVGVIIVAIVGNAAEHSTAITMALKNKMDLSLGIAVGSSLQIALFVAPVLVFASYLFPHQLSLEFTLPEIAAVVLAAFVTDQIAGDGESNWLEGVQLLALYLIVGVLFYFLPEAHHATTAAAPAH